MIARPTTPPAAPPAIAAVFDDPLPEDLPEEPVTPEVAEDGDPATRVEAPSVVVTCPAPATEVELVAAPRTAPGSASGESPTVSAVMASQRLTLVSSMRAHFGTRVPDGTGLGNVEGGIVSEQLVMYSVQGIHVCPWHASQALRRLYPMVLHLHKFVPSAAVGPVYENPGNSGFMVNVPELQVAIKYAATVHAFWPRVLNDHSHAKLQSGETI